MTVDTHLHLAGEYDDINEVVKNAYKNGVFYLIISGSNPVDNEENMKIISKFNNIYATVGYHPEFADNFSDADLKKLDDLILSNKKVVAIGEIGLDYHYDKGNRKKQIYMFKKQLDIAERYNLPVVVHTRDAFADTYNILKEYRLKGVIHCFSGSLEVAKKYIKLGYYLGIGGVITFKNSKLNEVIKEIGLSYIILETDSPYLSPIRGKKNVPANIVLIKDYLAMLFEIEAIEVEKITTSNVNSLFDLDV